MKADRNEALRALEGREWPEDQVTVVTAPAASVLVGLPARFRPDVVARVKTEAEARGVPDSVILRELVDEAYAARDAAGDEPMLVRPSDVARVLRAVAQPERPAA